MKFTMILATSYNHVIGTDDNPIPWQQSTDQKNFYEQTVGKLVVYGSNTLKTLPWAYGFPKRHNLVLTSKELALDTASGSQSLGIDTYSGKLDSNFVSKCADLIAEHGLPEEVIIAGGADVYKQALAELPVDKILHTLVHTVVESGSAITVPMFHGFEQTYSEMFSADADNDHDFSFITWERKNGS